MKSLFLLRSTCACISFACLQVMAQIKTQIGEASPAGVTLPSGGVMENLREVFEGATVFQRISETEPTRLVIPGSRIRRTTYVKSDLTVMDDGSGAAFIQPLVNNKRLTVFVTLETGATFTLVLQTDAAMSASNIRLVERREQVSAIQTMQARSDFVPAAQRSVSYETAIHELMMAASTGRLDQGMDVSTKQQEFTLWTGSRFVLQRTISSMDMTIDVFALTNLTQQPMRVVEQELYRTSVLAVAIESHLLNPGDSTTVYIVRSVEQ